MNPSVIFALPMTYTFDVMIALRRIYDSDTVDSSTHALITLIAMNALHLA